MLVDCSEGVDKFIIVVKSESMYCNKNQNKQYHLFFKFVINFHA